MTCDRKVEQEVKKCSPFTQKIRRLTALERGVGPQPKVVVSSCVCAAMAQKITCRPLKGDTFDVEVNGEASVADLKKAISEKHSEMPADQQKLIHQGKILDDKTAVKDIGIKEGEFVVVMVAKAKPPAAPAAPAAPAPAPAAPTPVPSGPSPGVDAGAAGAATVVSGAAAEATVQQLMEMGFERPQVERCLQAAFGNPDRAVEYLMSGIPAGLMAEEGTAAPGAPPEGAAGGAPPASGGGMAPSPAMTGAFPAMPTGAGGGGGGGGGNVAALEELRNHPRFGELQQAVAANPQMLPQILMALEHSNPGLVQVIRENPEAFMRLLSGGGGGAQQDPVAAMLAAAQGGAPGGPPPGQQVVRLTPEEGEAVQRLTELGFDRGMAVQAYLACDKNEELAANFLFENAMQED